LLVTQFQLAAMSRTDVPESSRTDFHLYVDECHNFLTESFASILSEARKYHLCLTLSHQYSSQLRPETLDAVLGNVGNIIAFRVGEKDGKMLEREFAGTYPTSAFTSLQNYSCIAKLMEHGEPCDAVVARTYPPLGRHHGRSKEMIARSNEKYAIRRTVVEDKIDRWMRSRR
jgi:hypothetical protein